LFDDWLYHSFSLTTWRNNLNNQIRSSSNSH